jgi:isoleucyl-tRNA synthetase
VSELSDKQLALGTMRHVLQNLALVMAPVMPFYAEYLWQVVKGDSDAVSVHLGAWPKGGMVDTELLTRMETVRFVVTSVLQIRANVNIKVRQPLAKLSLVWDLDEDQTHEMTPMLKDELNVKEVEYKRGLAIAFELDTTLTPELIAEGQVRELMRGIQEQRKTKGLAPQDRVVLTVATTDAGQALIEQFKDVIMKTVGATVITYGDTAGNSILAGEHSFTVSLSKVV